MADKKEEKYSSLTAAQETYILMYHEYFVLNWNYFEIARYHKVTKAIVTKAINWVIENKIRLPSKSLLQGAMDAVSARLKENKRLYFAEADKKKQQDKNFLIALNREIREDEKMLYRMQEVIKEADEGDGHNAAIVLKILADKKTVDPAAE